MAVLIVKTLWLSSIDEALVSETVAEGKAGRRSTARMRGGIYGWMSNCLIWEPFLSKEFFNVSK